MTTPRARWAWRVGTILAALTMLATLVSGPYRFLLGPVASSEAAGPGPAECLPGQEVPVMDSPQVSAAAARTVSYNSTPPTSGPHYSFTAAPGRYDGPIAEGLTVHAMRRGHVVIQYAPGTAPSTVARLTELARRYSRDVILAPYPELSTGVALTAWGRIDRLDGYDEARIVSFVERLRGRYVYGWQRQTDC